MPKHNRVESVIPAVRWGKTSKPGSRSAMPSTAAATRSAGHSASRQASQPGLRDTARRRQL